MKGHMPLMLCTVREALLIREGARHRVSRGKEVSATWRGRKKKKKKVLVGVGSLGDSNERYIKRGGSNPV